jgi:hypothetical protein
MTPSVIIKEDVIKIIWKDVPTFSRPVIPAVYHVMDALIDQETNEVVGYEIWHSDLKPVGYISDDTLEKLARNPDIVNIRIEKGQSAGYPHQLFTTAKIPYEEIRAKWKDLI